jgi:hypothetical protein
MTKFSSKTAHLISRLEKLASIYASLNDYSQSNYIKKWISDLRNSKIGSTEFANLEKNAYHQAIAHGITWDEEWFPKGVTKKLAMPSRTPHADALRYDKMISYLCSRISELRTTCQLSIHDRNAADNFLQYIRDNQHSQIYRAAKWISETCNRFGVTWAPGMSINELKEYLNGLYGDQKQSLAGGESMQYESSIVVKLGNPCSEIELPMDSLPSQGLAYIRETQELNPLHLI